MNYFIKKIASTYSFETMFDQHIKMFDFKHNQELLFLNDIKFKIFENKNNFNWLKLNFLRSFIEKKCQIDNQHSKSMINLCDEFIIKKYKKLNDNDLIQEM